MKIILDILNLENVEVKDKLCIVLRSGFIDEKILRLFAVKCCRNIQHFIKDPRSLGALDTAEAYALGKATEKELELARKEAYEVYSAIGAVYYTTYAVFDAMTADSTATACAYTAATYMADITHSTDTPIYDIIRNKQVEILKELILNR
jgi:hypothetical protein